MAIGAPGDPSAHIVFALPSGSNTAVAGTVFSDANGNGIRDAGEQGIEGHRMLAIDHATLDVMDAYTKSDGTYAFESITPAPATTLVQTWYYPPGTTVADPASSWFRYVMPEAGSTVTFDVGFHPVQPEGQATLNILACGDDNFNGRMDAGEAGIVGLDDFYVYTYTLGPDAVVFPDATDANGGATVTGLVPVDFEVTVFADQLAGSGYVWTSTAYERDDATTGKQYDPAVPVVYDPEPGSTHTMVIGLASAQ